MGALLNYLGSRLSGYKTILGGLGLILLGIVGIIGTLFPDLEGIPKMDIAEAIVLISGGFAALGLGHKAEKLIAAGK